MPTPSAYGSTFTARDPAFSSTYNAGNIDVGTGGVYVHGWVYSTGSTNSVTNADAATGRPGGVTVGGTPLTLGALQDRNVVFGASSGGWVAEVFGFLPGKTGSQAVAATQVTGGGAPSNSGKLWVDLQVYNNVTSVPVKTAIPLTAAAGNAISTAFTSASGRLDVMSTHTSMSPSSAAAMSAAAVAPSVLSSAAVPLVNAAVIADRPSAASTTLAVNTTQSFGFAYIGTQLSLAGEAPDTTPPTLSSPTGTGGTLSATGSVSTNESGGTLYYLFSANATETVPAQGSPMTGWSSQAVTATGVQNVSASGLTAGTRYLHFVHDDAATTPNRSARASSGSFTVAAGSGGTITSRPLVRNTGTTATDPWALHAPGQAMTCFVSNLATGALLVKRTGLLTNGAAVVSFTDAAVPVAPAYRVDIYNESMAATDPAAWGMDVLPAT